MYTTCGNFFRSKCACYCQKEASETEVMCSTLRPIPSGIKASKSLRGTNIDFISGNIGTISSGSIQMANFMDMYTLSNPSPIPPGINAGESLRCTNIDTISGNIGTISNGSIQMTNFTNMYTLSNPSPIPPGIKAGESVKGTNIDTISRSIGTIINVSIQITNLTDMYTLSSPRFYTSRGYCLHPPQPTISKKTSEACSFDKAPYGIFGCFGVLAYKILKDKDHFVGDLTIMFSCDMWYENRFALGIYEKYSSCVEKRLNQMYYKDGPFTRSQATGSEITYYGKGICVKGIMSSAGNAIIKVEFQDL